MYLHERSNENTRKNISGRKKKALTKIIEIIVRWQDIRKLSGSPKCLSYGFMQLLFIADNKLKHALGNGYRFYC